MGVRGEPVFAGWSAGRGRSRSTRSATSARVGRIEAAAARHRGLFLTGNAYRGVAMNDCTEQAEVVAFEEASALSVKLSRVNDCHPSPEGFQPEGLAVLSPGQRPGNDDREIPA